MSSGESRERRKYRRMRLSTRVDLMVDDGRGFVSEATGDVSEGGMFIATADPLPPGTVFVFGLRPRRGFPPVRGRGEVMWLRDGAEADGRQAGMGVRFLDLGNADRDTIRSLLVFETEVEMDFVADEAPALGQPVPTPVASAELRQLSDVFPPPGETGIGFFAVQEAANRRQKERRYERARRTRTRRLALTSLAVAAACATLILWFQRHALALWWANRNVAADVISVAPGASAGSRQAPLSPAGDAARDAPFDPVLVMTKPATAVVDLECAADELGTVVRIRGNGSFLSQQLRFEALQSPPRFVIRILGISHPFRGGDRAPMAPQVLGVRIGHHPELDVPQLYVVLDLASADLYSLPPEIDGDELVIRLVNAAAGLS